MTSTAESATLIASAREAEAAYDWHTAADAYERALTQMSEAGATPVEQAPLLASIGHCYRCLGEARTAWRSLMRAITIFREAGNGNAMVDASLEALEIWSPPDRQRGIAQAALEMLGPGESRRHAHLLFWLDRDDEAMAIARKNNYEEMLAADEQWTQSQQMVIDGHMDEYVALCRRVHELRHAIGDIDRAAGALRGPGYSLLAYGDFTRGLQFAEEAAAYAGERNLRFQHQLAALDVAGVYFARNQLDRCEVLLDAIPGDLDFRKDIFRSLIAERRGDVEAAVALLPSPERAGGARGALTQVHSARAGVLWRAGREDAARRHLEAFVAAGRKDLRLLHDAPVAYECIMGAGDESLWRAIREQDAYPESLNRYSTLQGRGLDRVRGGLALALGLQEDAAAHFRAGITWADAEGITPDAAWCREGLAAAEQRSESTDLLL